MPRRPTNPFTSNSPISLPSFSQSDEKGGILQKTPASKTNRLVQLFSTSPKSKLEAQSATAALLAASAAQQQSFNNSASPPISSALLSLPTISLSTATADSANM